SADCRSRAPACGGQRAPAGAQPAAREPAMLGATLSRWTLAYFGGGVFFLLAAEALMALGVGYPASALRAPQTLLLVHCVTVGWLSLLMCGALFQFVPVLVAGPLYSNVLPLPA